MNKNNVIFFLFVAALLGSTWGAIVNRQKIDLAHQLRVAQAELQKTGGRAGKEVRAGEEIAAVRAQETQSPAQAVGTQQELDALRREFQGVTAKLSGCQGALAEQASARDALAEQLERVEAGIAAGRKAGEDSVESLSSGAPEGPAAAGMEQALAETRAQLLGLEKIVEEKEMALTQAAQEKERLQINMDVLLAKIAAQQAELQVREEANRDLVKQLAAKEER